MLPLSLTFNLKGFWYVKVEEGKAQHMSLQIQSISEFVFLLFTSRSLFQAFFVYETLHVLWILLYKIFHHRKRLKVKGSEIEKQWTAPTYKKHKEMLYDCRQECTTYKISIFVINIVGFCASFSSWASFL